MSATRSWEDEGADSMLPPFMTAERNAHKNQRRYSMRNMNPTKQKLPDLTCNSIIAHGRFKFLGMCNRFRRRSALPSCVGTIAG
jgi:hypothetical protein